MNAEIDFAPLLPMAWLIGLAVLSALAVILSLALRSPGWAVRGLAALALLAAALSIFRYPAKYYGLALWRKLTGRPAVE